MHLFGENDSPCIVNFVIKNITKDKYDTDHIVAKSIHEDFCMDNFKNSGNSLETLIHKITSVKITFPNMASDCINGYPTTSIY